MHDYEFAPQEVCRIPIYFIRPSDGHMLQVPSVISMGSLFVQADEYAVTFYYTFRVDDLICIC